MLKIEDNNKVLNIVRYIIGGIFALGSISNLIKGNWYGIIEILFAISCFPFIYTILFSKVIKNNKILKIIQITIPIVLLVIFFMISYSKVDTDVEHEENDSNSSTETETVEEPKELTESEKMVIKLSDLIDEGLVYDTGDYIQGEIPAGEYAFVKFDGSGSYYEEDDAAGNIIDNENFDSFGYVKVHASGNLETGGVLVSISAFDKLGVKGAKELYEILNDHKDWNQSGCYKVGVDIDPGKYVLESLGSGYWEINKGPIGSGDIVDNDNFNGKASVNIKNGQYLKLSRAKFIKS